MARLLALLACVTGAGFSSGCANAVDATLLYGTYNVSVSAFGKSDDTIVSISEGSDSVLLFHFTHGFTTDYDAKNATGLRVGLDGSTLIVDMQPVHVEHSSGTIDGTVTGTGSTGGASVDLVLKVLPTNVAIVGPDGTPLPAGSTVDYTVKGSK